jgi:hypothetical protein
MNDLDSVKISFGKSTKTDENVALFKRARSKYLSEWHSLRLINANPESPLIKSYFNTYHCTRLLVEDEETNNLKAKYCKNRWCPVCTRIKTAQTIHRYEPIIKLWDNAMFVTLTAPTVEENDLEKCVNDRICKFKKSIERIKKRRLRSNSNSIIGIRALEITYNIDNNWYHPHFHVIVKNQDDALELNREWLISNPNAKSISQIIKPVNSDVVYELFKYVTKMIGKGKGKELQFYPPKQLDSIYRALRGKRTFQNFGFTAPPEPEEKELTKADLEKADKIWEWYGTDWVDKKTGELLTGYEPNENIIKIMKNSK